MLTKPFASVLVSNKFLRLAFFFAMLLLSVASSYGQICDPGANGLPVGGGVFNNDNGDICANSTGNPLAEMEIRYTNVNDGGLPNTVEFFIDWDDGTTETLRVVDLNISNPSPNRYEAIVFHQFPAAGPTVQCEYSPTVFLQFSGTQCLTSAAQPPPYLRWNTDDENTGNHLMAEESTNAVIYQVCAGESATVRFTDQSIFNCVPPDYLGFANDSERWTQFVYGTTNTITGGVEVDGTVEAYPFDGIVENNNAVPVIAPFASSLFITVPATATVGQLFEITMKSWNFCNPYTGDPSIDFIDITAQILIIESPAPPSDPSIKICQNDAVTLTSLGGANTVVRWYADAGLSTFITQSPTMNPVTQPAPADRLDNTLAGEIKIYYATAVLGTNNCESQPTPVTVEVVGNPTNSNAGPNQTVCAPTATLAANAPGLGTGVWTVASGPGNVVAGQEGLPGAQVENLSTATDTEFRWTITNDICVSFSNITIQRDISPPLPNAGLPQSLCADSYVLQGNDPGASAIGTWTGPPGVTFSDDNAFNATVSNLLFGVNTLTWTIANSCASNFATVDIDFQGPSASVSGPDIEQCQNGDFTMAANTPTAGVGQWSQTGGSPVTITNNLSPTTTVTGLAVGLSATLTWTITKAPCPDSFSDITITNYVQSTANAGTGGDVCEIGSTNVFNLSAVASVGSGQWTKTAGPGTETFSNELIPTSTVYVNNYGLYTFRWTETNGTCSDFAEVQVGYFQQTIADADGQPGAGSYIICDLVYNLTGAQSITGSTAFWEQMAGPGTTNFGNDADFQTTATADTYGIYTYRLTETNGSCTSNELVTITMGEYPNIITQPVNQLQCETFDTQFTVALAASPTFNLIWERSLDGGLNYAPVLQGIGANGEIYSNPTLPTLDIQNLSSLMDSYLFRARMISTLPGNCLIYSDEVILNVSPDAEIPPKPTGPDFRCQGGGTDLYFTTSNFAVQGYNWSVVPPEAGTFRDGGTGPGLGLTDSESITWAPEFTGTAEINVEAVGCSSTPIPAVMPISVTVEPTPTTSDIVGGNQIVNGEDYVCVDQGFFYAVDPPSGSSGSTYTWTLSPLDGNEPLLSDFGNLVLLQFQTTPWSGTLEVVETTLTCIGPPVMISLGSFDAVIADAGVDVEVCERQEVQLGTPSATGGSGAYIYSWAPTVGLDDPTLPQPMASPPKDLSPITYTLTVTDANTGCGVDTDEVQVIVNTSPILAVNASATSGCSPLTVDFDNSSLNVFANKWYWRLKGTTDENEIMTSYDVSYTLVNNSVSEQVFEVVYQGSSGICTDEVVTEILVYPTVAADFTVAPGNILVLGESTVTVTNNSINKASWDHLWNFGDGITSTDVDPAPHEYTMFGDFNLSLTLTDPASGCDSTQTELIRVQAVLPVVDFEVDKTSGCRPLTVTFTNTSFSVDPNSFIWEITNQFGQNVATSREVSPTITFYDAGILNVTLSGTNPLGVVDSKTELELIEVYELPTASFNVTPATVYLPDQLLFTNNLSSLADEFMWDLNGDGEIDSELFEPTYLYDQEGFYDVSLIAINSATGCADTLLTPKAVNVVKSGTTDVPNAFFPSEDDGSGGVPGSENSTFLPKTYGVEDGGFIMQIFDRWGHLLFESQDKSVGWNGRDKNGRLYASSVYVYKLDLRYLSGEHSVIVGDVSLMR